MVAQQLNQIKQSVATRTVYLNPGLPEVGSTVEKACDLRDQPFLTVLMT